MTQVVSGGSPTLTREAILAHARVLPAAPQVLTVLCEHLQDVNTDLGQIAGEIRFDPALAARVIRMSNSAVFGGQRLGSVDEAVNRVGFNEVLRLVGAATVAGLVDRSLVCYGIAAERLRESLLLHALASEALAAHTDIDGRTAYSAALLRGIGMMVLDRAGRAFVRAGEGFDRAHFAGYQAWEKVRFGMGSMDVTRVILDEWRFPPAVAIAVQEHLLLSPAGWENRFACVLNLAGAIVAECGLALPGESSCWTFTPQKLVAAGIDEDRFRAAAVEATALFERHRRVF